MTLKTARLTVDRASLPLKSSDLGIRFERHSVAKIKAGSPPSDMVLIRPAGVLLGEEEAVGPEPRWNHIICGMQLQAMDGTNVQGKGQLIITGQRFIGMIDDGTAAGGPPLSMVTSGSIFCFTCHRDDVYPPQVKKHRLTPSDFSFRSREDQAIGFKLQIFMAMAYVANDKMGYWHDKNMLHILSEEGRQGMLKS
jgi:hypothetical protein